MLISGQPKHDFPCSKCSSTAFGGSERKKAVQFVKIPLKMRRL